MNWRNTWLLVGVALALFAFIFLYERHIQPTDTAEPALQLLARETINDITNLQVRLGNQFVIVFDRTNNQWRYTRPFTYPAATLAIDGFLESIRALIPTTYITAQEILARKQSPADFGLDTPQIVISMQSPAGPQKIHFGARTTSGDQLYTEVVGKPGIYVVPAAILERLPRTQHDWRDTALFSVPLAELERCEIIHGGSGFLLQRDPTNQLWRLRSPSHRADQVRVALLLQKLQALRVLGFASDDPRIDPEPLGLQAPVAEATFFGGTVAEKVQFGRSPTNDPTRIYARLLTTSNVVLVSRTVLETLSTPYTELRDRRLIAFAPELIDTIEVKGDETFTLQRQNGNVWSSGDNRIDSNFVNRWLNGLSELEVTGFVKDVVTDFAPFALEPPLREYTLRLTVTNASGPTNVLVGRFSLGTNENTAYARRWDEASVYSVHLRDYLHMPGALWQLRSHQVWNFATNQVLRVTSRAGERAQQFIRQPNGDWIAGPGLQGEVNPFALEELMFRLGQLSADRWVARGEAMKEHLGFSTTGFQVSIDLRDGESTRTVLLEFGGISSLPPIPFACTTIDGEPWIFEFPWPVYADLERYLAVPGTRRALQVNPPRSAGQP